MIRVRLVAETRRRFLSNAEMFFDGSDPLERVVDFPAMAGDVVDFLPKRKRQSPT
jgi:hypothetical protein